MCSRLCNACAAVAMIVAMGGCSKTDSPTNNPQPGSPKVTATNTSTDLRKLSDAEVAAKIKEHLGDEYKSVSLTSKGENKFVGTATANDGKNLELSVTVTDDTISYTGEGKEGDGFQSGTIKESKTVFKGSVKTP